MRGEGQQGQLCDSYVTPMPLPLGLGFGINNVNNSFPIVQTSVYAWKYPQYTY